jgi:hypothetical protein
MKILAYNMLFECGTIVFPSESLFRNIIIIIIIIIIIMIIIITMYSFIRKIRRLRSRLR